MERLTEKVNGEYIHKVHKCSLNDCYEKLGKLEDIEQELGIPLEVLFKALLKGILDKKGRYHSKVRLSNKIGYISLVDEEYYCYDTKKYLETWWIIGGEK